MNKLGSETHNCLTPGSHEVHGVLLCHIILGSSCGAKTPVQLAGYGYIPLVLASRSHQDDWELLYQVCPTPRCRACGSSYRITPGLLATNMGEHHAWNQSLFLWRLIWLKCENLFNRNLTWYGIKALVYVQQPHKSEFASWLFSWSPDPWWKNLTHPAAS